MGIVNVLKACVDSGAKRLIYSASSSAYGDSKTLPLNESLAPNPISPYGTKVLRRNFMQDIFKGI